MGSISTVPGRMRLLLLNPNSNPAMTASMAATANATPISELVEVSSYTAPSNVPMGLSDDAALRLSTDSILADISAKSVDIDKVDAVLVACYSVHGLVPALSPRKSLAVTGIFEASIMTALSVLKPSEQWGIVTTNQFYDKHLCDGVNQFLDRDAGTKKGKFAGVTTTGLTAEELHTASPDLVRERLREATVKLLQSGNITCVILGCGGMVGLEDTVRAAAEHVYGDRARGVYVVDPVKAGVLQLYQTVCSQRLFGIDDRL